MRAFPLPTQPSQLALGIILLAGLLHGLLYVFLVPPWQHYDEPGHFEYAWLLANHGGHLPMAKADTDLRRQLAASMVEYDFFAELNFRPNLLLSGGDIWIGVSQTDDSPLYYALVAAPLWLVRHSDVTFQLYLARLVSLALYLLTVFAAFGIICELVPASNPLRWLVPLTMVLMPGFTDLMTAVNNDAGAVAALSFFLWTALAIIRRGFSASRIAALIVLCMICAAMKSTSAIALPLALIPLAFAGLTGRRRRLAWILMGLGLLVLLVIGLRSGGAAAWYPGRYTAPCRTTSANAPLGKHAFQLVPTSPPQQAQIVQPLPADQARLLAGETITLGAWIWTDIPAPACLPAIYTTSISQAACVTTTTTTEPVFHAISMTLPADISLLRVALLAPQASVFYDGIVLTRGDFASRGAPRFTDPNGSRGEWDGEPFENLLRNASAEQGWLAVWPRLDSAISRAAHIQPATVLTSLSDWNSSRGYYRSAAFTLLRSFWARFGWGHISLPGGKPYRLLGGFTLAGLIGAGSLAWRKRRALPWDIAALIIATLIISWGAALTRGIQSLTGAVFIPVARYAYPAMIPTLLLLTAGWLEIARLAHRWLHLPLWVSAILYGLGFAGLDIICLLTIVNYYRLH